MIDKLISFFDEDHEFKQVWELKLIKFDIDLDEEVKPYQKYLSISHIVQDSKGNPGIRGHFYVTNLRFVWHGANDREINLSIGLDTINNVYIKPIMSGASQTKQMLIVKTQSPSGSKYEFKFAIFTDKQIEIFKKAIQIHKQAIATRLYRTIDTNIKINHQSKKFQTLPKQEIFNTYPESKYYESQKVHDCQIVLTNVRVVVIQTMPNRGISYGIPWIMIESFEKATHWDHPALQIKIRGLLSGKQIYIRTNKSFSKFEEQFTSLSTAYSKNPILGVDSSKAISKDSVDSFENKNKTKSNENEMQEVFQTKINIKRNKNQYAAQSTQGSLSYTFFNEQLGIMMQKLPEGVSRSSLWQILG